MLGRQLTLISKDHKGIAARGLNNLDYLAELPNCLAVFGGLHSPVVLAELEAIHQHELVFLVPWAAATAITDNNFNPNYVYRLSVRDADAGPFLIQKALEQSHRIALLLENTGWGRSNHQAMLAALDEAGARPVIVKWFNWGEKYFDAILDDIDNSDAEVIVFVGNAPEGAAMVNNLYKRPHHPAIIAHWGISGGQFWQSSQRALAEMDVRFLQTYSFLNDNAEANQDFFEHYQRKYHIIHREQINAPVGSAHAYDLMHLLAIAVRQAGKPERSAIRNALEQISSHQGLIKNYQQPFSTNDHDALEPEDFILARFDSRGVIVPDQRKTDHSHDKSRK